MKPDQVRCMDDLIRVVRAGAHPRFCFFWGHTPSPSGVVGKECLSQWYVAPFMMEGVRYPTAEHAMMAGKARLFGDQEALERILKAPSPKIAKAEGRLVRGFDEATWQSHADEIVVAANVAKFRSHGALAEFLSGTGKSVIVEASPRDRIWGIGMGQDHEHAEQPQHWRGLNKLGFALMEVRARIA